MATKAFFFAKHTTASVVVNANAQAILARVIINNAAATAVISVYDDTSSGSPQVGNLLGQVTAPAGGIGSPVYLEYGIQVKNGIVVTIATAAADVTVIHA